MLFSFGTAKKLFTKVCFISLVLFSATAPFLFFFRLDPEDPLAVLLLIDFYALKSEQYDYLIQLFNEWEVGHLDLSNTLYHLLSHSLLVAYLFGVLTNQILLHLCRY